MLTRSAVMLVGTVSWLATGPAHGALQFELKAGATSFREVSVASITARQTDAATVEINGIEHARLGRLGNLALRCPFNPRARCSDGRLTWSTENTSPLVFDFKRRAGQFTLTGEGGGRVRYRLAGPDHAELSILDVPAAWVPPPVLAEAGLADLSGSFSGMLEMGQDRVQGGLEIRKLAFDTPDGVYAGAGLALDLGFDWLDEEARLRLDANWTAGELLLGPVYLPSPEAAFVVELEAQNIRQDEWRVQRLALEQDQSISLTAAGRFITGDPVRVAALDLEIEQARLGSVWRQGLDSVAGSLGWSQLDPEGELTGRMRIEDDSVVSAGLRLSDVMVDDGAERLAVKGLGAWLGWEKAAESLEIGMNWQSARLLRIPLGASALAFRTDASGTLALIDSFRLPVLDGALVVERLAWHDWARNSRHLLVDARLEPLELSALTRALGWTEFGGRLSGNFPGIELSDGVIEVQGGLDIDLFGGSARINRLSVERPFGSLPALAADIEFDALDLEQVTGAFSFGRMLGLMSGHVRGLRLLDWQPVQFDAWLETLEDSPEREISQKAVDSISSLSGGGSAAISGTLLRWFDDFPYRKAGLGCRLAANVCRMRGLRDAENGGYVILDGRLIPRLDIVGYQRRVDWPRLLAQLAAAAASPE